MARREPKPISMKKSRAKKSAPVPDEPLEPFNKDAPEHQPKMIVQKVIKDKVLAKRVSVLEQAGGREIVVKVELPVRPRIERISIEYDPTFGHPKALIPRYGE